MVNACVMAYVKMVLWYARMTSSEVIVRSCMYLQSSRGERNGRGASTSQVSRNEVTKNDSVNGKVDECEPKEYHCMNVKIWHSMYVETVRIGQTESRNIAITRIYHLKPSVPSIIATKHMLERLDRCCPLQGGGNGAAVKCGAARSS